MLIKFFERIEKFFARLETYTTVPLTPEMTDNMAQITVEILDFLATITKEMKQNATSKSDLLLTFHDADIVSEKLLKRAIGQTNLEDGLKKLDKLTNEGARMAMAQVPGVTHNIYHEGMGINENVKEVNKKVHTIIGKQRLSSESSVSSLTSSSRWHPPNSGRSGRHEAFVTNSSSLTIQFLTDRRDPIKGKP